MPPRAGIPAAPTGDNMNDDLATKIASHPKYQELRAKRTGFGWWLTLAMMVVYYGFIMLVAFNKPFLAQRLGDGVMTVGIPLGFGVIVFTVLITAYYVRRANSEFDELTEAISKAVLK
jgi:uncharacterized membrane protein (DUF485 family)